MDPIMLFLANVPYFPEIFAEIAGRIHVAAAAIAAGIGVGMVGAKAAEAVGRNPSANISALLKETQPPGMLSPRTWLR